MRARITTGGIWGLAYPIILAGVGETLVDVIDVAFLAHYGVIEAGAVALADALYETVLVLVLGLIEGSQVLLARRAGQGSPREVGAVFRQSARLLALAALLVFAVVRALGPFVTSAAISSPEVRAAADDFLRVIVLGVPFEAANLLFGVLYIGLGRTRILMVATGVLAATNIVLDYGLVFGNLGLPELGIAGAAWATVTAECAAFLVFVAFALARGDVRRFGLVPGFNWDRALARRITLLSTPAALGLLVETLRWFLFFTIVERLGEYPLAGSNVLYSCYALLAIPIEGLSEATCSLVSRVIGQGRSTRLRPLLRRSLGLAWAVSAPLVLLTVALPRYALLPFTDDPQLIAQCAGALRVVGLALLVIGPGELLLAAVEGTGDTRATFRIECLAGALILGYVWVAGPLLEQPLAVVWLFLPAGWVLSVALASARLRSEGWRDLRI